MDKKPWQSKTILLNAIAGLLGAVAIFSPFGAEAQTWITGHQGEIALVWSVLNIALRFLTKEKIVLTD